MPRLFIAPITFIGRVWKIVTYRGWEILRHEILAPSNENPNGWHRLRLFASIAVIDRELPIAVLPVRVGNRAIGKQASACKRIAVVQISRGSKPLSKGRRLSEAIW